jgi:hypothetical protein
MSRADEHFEMDEWLASRSESFYKIMIVEFNSGGTNFIPVQQASTKRAGSAAANDDSSVSFSSQSLKASFQQASQPRPEKVAQATALANEASYPSDKDLNRLAGFLANRL